jgi:uncharacterized protein
MPFIERMEDADRVPLDHTVFFVALFDNQRDGDPVLCMEKPKWIFLGSRVGIGVVEDDRFAVSEYLAAESRAGAHSEQLEPVLVDPIAWRNANQLTLLPIIEHDRDLLGLQDHRDPLNKPPECDIGLVDGRDVHRSLRHRPVVRTDFGELCFKLADPFGGRLMVGFQLLDTLHSRGKPLPKLPYFIARRHNCQSTFYTPSDVQLTPPTNLTERVITFLYSRPRYNASDRMPKQLEELPLFPLNTVLFPFANLRLHIFEDRYREMIGTCLAEDRPFGIVLIRSGSEIGEPADPYLVGTAARIVSAERYADGKFDIHVLGDRRFRIRELDSSSRPYLTGRVEPVVEQSLDQTEQAEELIGQAREQFQTLVESLFEPQSLRVKVVFPSDPVELSFSIANLLEIENLEKQRLLETTDTLERVSDLLPLLRHKVLEAKPTSGRFRLSGVDLQDWIVPN